MPDQENLLERALRLAASEAAFIPEFYGTLLDADVFVVGRTELDADGHTVDVVAKPGSHLHIQTARHPDGAEVIPFFSSLPALRRHIAEETTYLRLAARDLFEMTLGQDLVLNPGSDHQKAFTAFEIDDLLRHGLPRSGDRQVIGKETSVLLGQPAEYPHDITETLSRYFETEPRVTAAYLALMQIPDRDRTPGLCVGIVCDPAQFDAISPAVGLAAAHLTSDDRLLSICLVDPKTPGTPGDYMLEETEPFYRAPRTPRRPPAPRTPAPPGGRRVFGKRNRRAADA